MQHAAPWPTVALARTARTTRRWRTWLAQAWRRAAGQDAAAALHAVADLAHLERRLKQLERGRDDRFAPLPPGL